MSHSTESTVNDLLANATTKSIVERHVPGLSSHPQIGAVGGMSLAVVAHFSGGQIPQDALDKIDTELKALG